MSNLELTDAQWASFAAEFCKGFTKEQLEDAHTRDLSIQSGEGVHFRQAWGDPVSGCVFCLSEGPSREAVLKVHERAGHPTDEIYELPIEVK